jgi:hypothetical protein
MWLIGPTSCDALKSRRATGYPMMSSVSLNASLACRLNFWFSLQHFDGLIVPEPDSINRTLSTISHIVVQFSEETDIINGRVILITASNRIFDDFLCDVNSGR